MKSRITIEVDFDNNNEPFIQVVNNHQSPDVRDKLLTHFRQSMQQGSWLRVEYPEFYEDKECVMMTIHVIKMNELKEQAEIMLEQDRLNKSIPI